MLCPAPRSGCTAAHSITPEKQASRPGVTVYPRGLGKPTHRVSARREKARTKREDSETAFPLRGRWPRSRRSALTTPWPDVSAGTPLPSCLPTRETCAADASPATPAGKHRGRGFAASAFSAPHRGGEARFNRRKRSGQGSAIRRLQGHRPHSAQWTRPPTRYSCRRPSLRFPETPEKS